MRVVTPSFEIQALEASPPSALFVLKASLSPYPALPHQGEKVHAM